PACGVIADLLDRMPERARPKREVIRRDHVVGHAGGRALTQAVRDDLSQEVLTEVKVIPQPRQGLGFQEAHGWPCRGENRRGLELPRVACGAHASACGPASGWCAARLTLWAGTGLGRIPAWHRASSVRSFGTSGSASISGFPPGPQTLCDI